MLAAPDAGQAPAAARAPARRRPVATPTRCSGTGAAVPAAGRRSARRPCPTPTRGAADSDRRRRRRTDRARRRDALDGGLVRMAEAEDTLRAIGAGEVDAFVVSDGGAGQRVFTLSTADRPYRIFVENMRDGAATLVLERADPVRQPTAGGAAVVLARRRSSGSPLVDVPGRRRPDRAGGDPGSRRAGRHARARSRRRRRRRRAGPGRQRRRSTSTASSSSASRSPTSAPRRPRSARSPGSARRRPSGWPTWRTLRRRSPSRRRMTR